VRMTRRFFLIRHGQTNFNARKIISGWDDAELTPTGLQQAEAVGLALKDFGPLRILSSDLLRARQTVEGVMRHLKGEVEFLEALRERDYGEFSGRTIDDYRQAFVDSGKCEETFYPAGGETKSALRKRVLPCIDAEISGSGSHDFLVVGHHGTNKVILSHLLGGSEAKYFQHNCCLNELLIYQGHLEIKRLNCIEHLGQK